MVVKKSVNFLLKNSYIIIPLFFILISIMSFYAVNLPIDPSFSSLIADDTEYNINERLISNVLDGNDVVQVFFKPDESSALLERPRFMDNPDVISYMESVKKSLSESKYVVGVRGPQFNSESYYARILLEVDTPRSIDGFRKVIDDLDEYFEPVSKYPGVDATITGVPLLFDRVNNLLIGDNIKTIGLSIFAVFFVLLFYFKSWRLSLITLSIPISSLIILAGLMTIFDIAVTITLAVVGILIVGLGVDFAIHVVVSYESYRERGYKHKKSIMESIDHLHIAIFGSLLTTAAGFAALMFGVSPSSQSQGLVLTMSITIVSFVTILILPSLIYVFADFKKLPPKNHFFNSIKSKLGTLAKYQTHHPKVVLSILGVLTVVMLFGATNVGFDTGNNNWIPDDDPIQETFRESNYAFGGTFSSLQLVLEGNNLRDVQTVRDIQQLEASLLSLRNIEDVVSPYTNLNLEREDIFSSLSGQFNKDYTMGLMSIRVATFSTESGGSSVVLDEIRDVIDNNPVYGTKITLFGDVIRFSELGAALGRDTGVTTLISFVVVFLIASFLYFSFKIGAVALLPVIIGIIWTLGFMGFFNVPFTSISTGLIALVLGTGIDFSIHLTNSTFNNIKEGQNLVDSIHKTMIYSGGALLLTSITTFIGFSSLIFASLLGIQRLGITLAFSILSVFLVTIISIPAILSLIIKNGHAVKK
ncbi:MAG: efflux RND transporter permease subunit [Nanoarchaeota archaeon]